MQGDADRAVKCVQNAFADPLSTRYASLSKIADDPARYAGNITAATKSGRPNNLQAHAGSLPKWGVEIDCHED